ncbi:MAG: hypothetical protein GX029_08060 [Pseudomonadaceae bacterium]|nr:hypothetical protein [Pseudomonadaceae bacterium]
MDQDNKPVKKKTKPNYFEQLMGGAGGRPAKNAVVGSSRSLSANSGKRLGKGNARGR